MGKNLTFLLLPNYAVLLDDIKSEAVAWEIVRKYKGCENYRKALCRAYICRGYVLYAGYLSVINRSFTWLLTAQTQQYILNLALT